MSVFINPFTYIASPSGGPLANGYIYIGTSSTDPTETVNQLAVRVVDDAGGFSPIDQPLRTNQYGLIVDTDGNPISIDINEDEYSVTIANEQMQPVFQDRDVNYLPDQSTISAQSAATQFERYGYPEYDSEIMYSAGSRVRFGIGEAARTYEFLRESQGNEPTDASYAIDLRTIHRFESEINDSLILIGRCSWFAQSPLPPGWFALNGQTIVGARNRFTTFFNMAHSGMFQRITVDGNDVKLPKTVNDRFCQSNNTGTGNVLNGEPYSLRQHRHDVTPYVSTETTSTEYMEAEQVITLDNVYHNSDRTGFVSVDDDVMLGEFSPRFFYAHYAIYAGVPQS